MDETEDEEAGDEWALPPFGADGAEGFAVAYGRSMSALQQAAAAEADARRQAFENAQRHIEQNSFGAPSRSEQLMRISQALLSRRDSRGIAGTLGNLVPALAQSQTDTREAAEQRAAALAQLQQQYATGTAAAATAGAQNNLDALQALAPNYRPQRPRSAYDQNRGTFVTEGEPVRETARDMIGPNNIRLEAYLVNGNVVYRTVIGGQQVYVNESGEQVNIGGAQ